MKTVVITGARRGLGLELARAFSAGGWNLVLLSRHKIEDRKGIERAFFLTGDLADPFTIEQRCDLIQAKHIDCLIHNAAEYHAVPFSALSATDVERSLRVNLLAPLLLTKRLWGKLEGVKMGAYAKYPRGLVVNITSVAATTPAPGESVYAAAKAGLQAFTKTLNREAGEDGPHAIDVVLGAMTTGFCSGRDTENCIDPAEAAIVIFNLVNDYQKRKTLQVPSLELKRLKY